MPVADQSAISEPGPGVRLYTNTVAGVPEVETDVQETEEVLPDGTVIKKKVVRTKQKQLITKTLVLEGPEDELPQNEQQAEEMLGQMAPDMYGNDVPAVPDVQEYEETLPDGSIARHRVITTTMQELSSEKATFDEDDDVRDVSLNGKTDETQLASGFQWMNIMDACSSGVH